VHQARERADWILVGAAELATPVGSTPRLGPDLGAIRVLERGGVAVRDERIVAVGPEAELRQRFDADRVLDACGGTVVPGFVDAHTHPVFAGTREDEFELRSRGASYLEIARAGGGILSTVRGVRGASREELLEQLLVRLARFLDGGTTTIEAKSGYGLSPADEAKSLEVLKLAHAQQPIEIVPTFLGAHCVPPEHERDRRRYVDLLVEEMLPRVAEQRLAEYCDVFQDAPAFKRTEAERILGRAKALGLGLRIHADQMSASGGAEVAAELGAASADHLEHVTQRGIEALAASGVVAVLCPLVPLFLRTAQEAPARRMIEARLALALSTDFNPGSCYTQSMREVLTFAALRYAMSAGECLTAATLNAACSLGRGQEIGSLEPGKRADLVVLDHPNHRHLCYEFGRSAVRMVVVRGVVVRDAGARTS
jgi:imidazolonepropionase